MSDNIVTGEGVARFWSGGTHVDYLKVEKIFDNVPDPIRAHPSDAGLDLHYYTPAEVDVSLTPGASHGFETGLKIALPKRHVGLIYVRSSLGAKKNVTLSNSVGVIDADYRGELIVFLTNNGTEDVTINHGDRVAQLVISPIITPAVKVVDALDETVRGDGGFGSTGA